MSEASEKHAAGYQSFYQQNKGVIFVLTAQLFGVLMNVTTRLLEIEGNHGEGMHPFQVHLVAVRNKIRELTHSTDPLRSHGHHHHPQHRLHVVEQDPTLSIRPA